MNKVVAVLGIIVVITLGALFFFAGFYMGNTTTFGKDSSIKTESTETSDEKKLSQQDIEAKISAQSNSVSEKVMKIISSGADNISNSVSKVVTKISHQKASQMSSDALLKEILASHSEYDNCSPEKTEKDIKSDTKYSNDNLRGKKVVFIGYFKDNIALQIQQLLVNKGYKVHVEQSKTCLGESFIFSGPFRKKENADKLVDWLKAHDFSEAKVINVIQESVEKTISDTMDDDSTIPENEEEIPEVNKEELQNLTSNAELSEPSQGSNNNMELPAASQNLTGNVRYPQNLNNNAGYTMYPQNLNNNAGYTVYPQNLNNNTGGLTGYPQNTVTPTFTTNYQQINGQIPATNQMQNFQINQQPAMLNYR